MSFVKNGILLAIGGMLGAFFAAVMKEDSLTETEQAVHELAAMDRLIDKLRIEGEAALAECKTDEEREAVYEKIRKSVEDLKAELESRGNALIEEFRCTEAAEAVEAAETVEDQPVQPTGKANEHMENIKATLDRFSASLDETLKKLAPQPPAPEG